MSMPPLFDLCQNSNELLLFCFASPWSAHFTTHSHTLILTHARVSASSFCVRGTILIINQGFVNKCQRCEISISHQNSSKLTIANWQFSLLSLLWLPLLLLLSLSLSCRSHSRSRSSELTSLLASVASLISGWDFPEKLFDGTYRIHLLLTLFVLYYVIFLLYLCVVE